ncbi:hypothetical protein M0R45_034901 [Rubus argutus]|uniref:Alcohol dehydrogenase N-terminal domain-containing protein n=1 Tax=Rubus argutus TaxID=59490 RepID=A0AAW1VVZ1_RUBAR
MQLAGKVSISDSKVGLRYIVTSCRAVVLLRFGGPEVLELRPNVDVPDIKPSEVLVRSRAVSINPFDTRVSPPLHFHYASRDLIRGLLVKEPQHRLGVKRGATEIKLASVSFLIDCPY